MKLRKITETPVTTGKLAADIVHGNDRYVFDTTTIKTAQKLTANANPYSNLAAGIFDGYVEKIPEYINYLDNRTGIRIYKKDVNSNYSDYEVDVPYVSSGKYISMFLECECLQKPGAGIFLFYITKDENNSQKGYKSISVVKAGKSSIRLLNSELPEDMKGNVKAVVRISISDDNAALSYVDILRASVLIHDGEIDEDDLGDNYVEVAKMAKSIDDPSSFITMKPVNSDFDLSKGVGVWVAANGTLTETDEGVELAGTYNGSQYPHLLRGLTLSPGIYAAYILGECISKTAKAKGINLASNPGTFATMQIVTEEGAAFDAVVKFTVQEEKTFNIFSQITPLTNGASGAGDLGTMLYKKIGVIKINSADISDETIKRIFKEQNEGTVAKFSLIDTPVDNGTPWGGKKWAVLGDSITYLGTYIQPVIKALELGDFVKIAQGGRRLAGEGTEGNPAMNTDAVLNIIPLDTDLITIMGGTNDWASNIPIGTIDDADNSTYYGALKVIVNKISTQIPKARLVFCTPPYGELYNRPGWPNAYTNTIGLTLSDYAKAVIKVGKVHGIPVADIGANAGWNTYNIRTFVRDDGGLLHPLQAGGDRMASVIVGTLLAIPLIGF